MTKPEFYDDFIDLSKDIDLYDQYKEYIDTMITVGNPKHIDTIEPPVVTSESSVKHPDVVILNATSKPYPDADINVITRLLGKR